MLISPKNNVIPTIGKMADEVTYIPKYLRPLKLSLVNGLESRSAAYWYNFTAGLEQDSNTQEYDLEYGNPGELIKILPYSHARW